MMPCIRAFLVLLILTAILPTSALCDNDHSEGESVRQKGHEQYVSVYRLIKLGRYRDANMQAKDFFNSAWKTREDNESEMAQARLALGRTLVEMGKSSLGGHLCSQASRYLTDQLGADHPMAVDAKYCLAKAFFAQDQYDKAMELLSYPHNDKIPMCDKSSRLHVLRKLLFARCLAARGKYRAALEELESCLDGIGSSPSVPDSRRGAVLLEIGKILYDMGMNDDAETILYAAQDVLDSRKEGAWPYRTEVLLALAEVHHNTGETDEAYSESSMALEQIMSSYGHDHPFTGIPLYFMGMAHYSRAETDRAEDKLTKAVDRLSGRLPGVNAYVTTALESLIEIAENRNHTDRSILLRFDLLGLQEEGLPETCAQMKENLSSLIACAKRLGRHGEAALFQARLERMEKSRCSTTSE
jgi:tetratricopeptide (TPR) repeat protein